MNEENGVIFIIDFLMPTMAAKNLRFLALYVKIGNILFCIMVLSVLKSPFPISGTKRFLEQLFCYLLYFFHDIYRFCQLCY